jgi:ABC-2 type transport system permease protein
VIALAANLRTALPFARVGFLNMLAYRARYYVGVLTYLFNVAVYFFIWRAVFAHSESVAGLKLSEMITYVAVGWTIRSFYFNEIDRDIASQVQEGRLAMNLIRPVDFQLVCIADAAGQSAFRAALFTLPIGVLVGFLFRVQPPGSLLSATLFLLSALLSFFLVAAINFLVGLIAIRTKSIQGILRAKYLILELLSGLLIPTTLFPEPIRTILLASPLPHINYTPAALYLGKVNGLAAARALLLQAAWTAGLLAWGQMEWRRSRSRITIQGG